MTSLLLQENKFIYIHLNLSGKTDRIFLIKKTDDEGETSEAKASNKLYIKIILLTKKKKKTFPKRLKVD